MPVSSKQLSFSDISTDFDKSYNQNQNNLLSLLNKFINMNASIPFYQNYSNLGSKEDSSLESMPNTFIFHLCITAYNSGPTMQLLLLLYSHQYLSL